MTDLRQAAQAAADYLERRWRKSGATDDDMQEQFTALRAALAAQQAAQPVAWGSADAEGRIVDTCSDSFKRHSTAKWLGAFDVPLFAAAQPQQATPYPASEYGVDQWWFKEMAALWCAIPGSTITHDQKRAAKIAVHAVQALIAAQPQQADLTRAGGAA